MAVEAKSSDEYRFVCWMSDGKLEGVNRDSVVRFCEDENNGISIYLSDGSRYTLSKDFFCESVLPLLGAAIAVPRSQVSSLTEEGSNGR